ncbi:MAG: replicative DNA helicase [Clostridiales bacterium]|jgi:replicative DNA helicase|nr:replicative DNA helicase [Clostridiales bacterium]
MANENQNHPNLSARIPPHNIEAEQSVLGCVMIDRDAPVHILGELAADDFYLASHREIFTAMLNLMLADKPVDIVMLVQELETMGGTERAGGLSYLTSLSNLVPSASNYRHYTEIVKKTSLLRRLIAASQRIADKAFSGDPDDAALAFAEGEIYSLSEKLDRSGLSPLSKSAAEAIAKIELMYSDPTAGKGIPTGFKRLNDILNGLQRGDLVLIAARPGQGKTSIGMNIVAHAALASERKTAAGKPDPYRCAVFSLEMPAVQLAKRMLCAAARVDMTHANSGRLDKDEWKKLFDAKKRLDRAQIYIDDSSLTTPVEILSKCRRLKREKGLDLVMIDYLQLMTSGRRIESRQQEVSDITRMLKIAAKELNVPILLLSQMSREVEKRSNKLPQMSDLRESGAIEQDADIIIFIYREHDPHDVSVPEETRDKTELIIAKHRNGETGRVELRWLGKYVSFADVDKSAAVRTPPPENVSGFRIDVDDGADADIQSVPPPADSDGFKTVSGMDGKEILESPSGEEILTPPSDNDGDIF